MLETAELGAQISKGEYERVAPRLRVDLINVQYDLRKADFPVLVLIVGDDRVGCNAVFNLLHEWMDGRYLRTHAFGPPSDEEGERPRFWRYWRTLPRRGQIGVYFGGWPLQAISDRIAGRIKKSAFDRRLAHIMQFEENLANDGALILKFWLHLPKKELARRLKKAKKDREWGWWVEDEDWRILGNYDKGIPLVERLLSRTSTQHAPWQIVEGTDVCYRNLTVARSILAGLTARLNGSGPGTTQPRGASHSDAPELNAPSPTLAHVDLSAALDRKRYRKELIRYQGQLRRLSRRAREQGVSSVLVFEGWDAAGKGGVIRRLTGAMNAQDYRVVPIAAPTEEERDHHYLWRFWRHLPRAGVMLIFDRSWYGRVLVERVEGFAEELEWQRGYKEITDFEEQLVEHGLPVLKFWLHIDPETQLRRFKDREQTLYKKHKITDEDYRNREKWDEYVSAVNAMIARTSTGTAPWYVVSATDKRWARVKVLKTVCRELKRALKSA